MCRRQKGFTLLELLIVVGIISMLTAILIPILSNAKMQARIVVKYASSMVACQDKSTDQVLHCTFGEGTTQKTRDWCRDTDRGTFIGRKWGDPKTPQWVRGTDIPIGYESVPTGSRFGKGYYALMIPANCVVDFGNIDITDRISAEVWVCPPRATGNCSSGFLWKGNTIYGNGNMGEVWRIARGCASNNAVCAEVNTVGRGRITVQAGRNEGLDFTWYKWHHLAFTYGGRTLKFYVDGKLRGSKSGGGPLISNNDPVRAGGGTNDGIWDEVIVYSRVLGKYEIARHYNMSRPSGYPEADPDRDAHTRYP